MPLLHAGTGLYGRWSQSVRNAMTSTTGLNKNTASPTDLILGVQDQKPAATGTQAVRTLQPDVQLCMQQLVGGAV